MHRRLVLDLVKAFDRVLRELVVGLPSNVRSVHGVTANLTKLGVPSAEARQLARYLVAHGCIFHQWDIDPLVTELVAMLHRDACLSVGRNDGGKSVSTSRFPIPP